LSAAVGFAATFASKIGSTSAKSVTVALAQPAATAHRLTSPTPAPSSSTWHAASDPPGSSGRAASEARKLRGERDAEGAIAMTLRWL
jgi:hypothetical protein